MSLVYLIFQNVARSEYIEEDIELEYSTDNTEIPVEVPPVLDLTPSKPTFYFEGMMIILLVLFFVNLYIGKKKNERIATG